MYVLTAQVLKCVSCVYKSLLMPAVVLTRLPISDLRAGFGSPSLVCISLEGGSTAYDEAKRTETRLRNKNKARSRLALKQTPADGTAVTPPFMIEKYQEKYQHSSVTYSHNISCTPKLH